MREGRHDGTTKDRDLTVGAALFVCLFASQASVLALSPVLSEVASSFGVSTATAGQLRTVSGTAAGVTALLATPIGHRLGPRRLLRLGAGALVAGTLASGLAPTFGWLAGAQIVVGVGVAAVVAAGVGAATTWPSPARRRQVLSWTLNGQPFAWVVGMPLIGAAAGWGWRWAWLSVPLVSAVTASLTLRRVRVADDRAIHPRASSGAAVLGSSAGRRWALGELLAFTAWSGTLVYAGALFAETYGASPFQVGLALGAGALAYVPGNLWARRAVDGSSPLPLAVLAGALGVGIAVLGTMRPAPWFSVITFALLAGIAGARGYAGSVRGLALAPQDQVAIGSVRAAATQFGYLLGSALGGLALAAGGYAAVGATLGAVSTVAMGLTVVARHPASQAGVPRPWAPAAPVGTMPDGRYPR